MRAKLISGGSWNILNQIALVVINLVGSIILSRILSPENFGYIATVTSISNLGIIITTLGIGTAVIQNRTLTDKSISSLFWFSSLTGISVSILSLSLSTSIGDFFDQNNLSSILAWFSISFILYGINAVPGALLQRSFRFREMAIINLCALFISYGVAILLAKNDWGVYALLSQVMINTIVTTSVNLFLVRDSIHFTFSYQDLLKVKRFSGYFFLNSILEFIATNIDIILVGKFFGPQNLGLYSRALTLTLFPVTNISFLFSRTFFPVFSELQNQTDKLKQVYIKGLSIMSFVVIPTLAGMYLLSDEIILVLFGEKWIKVVWMFDILCWVGFLACFNAFNDSFITAQGRTDLLFKFGLIEKTLFFGSAFAGLPFGIEGVLIARLIVSFVTFVPKIFLLLKISEIKLVTLVSSQFKTVASVISMVIVVSILKTLSFPVSEITRMFLLVVFGAITYALSSIIIRNQPIFAIFGAVKELNKKSEL